MRKSLIIIFLLLSFGLFAQDSVLTKQGYKDVRLCSPGDSVLAYNIFTGARFYNAIQQIDTVHPVSVITDSINGVPVWSDIKFYTINNKYCFYADQSIWANIGVRLIRELNIGDTIYDDSNKEVIITSLTSALIPGIWYRFQISGDHSFILNGITLHNASKYWQGTNTWATSTCWYTDTTFSANTTVPTSSDNVYFTHAAGISTCTISALATCLNIDCHGWAGTITGTSTLMVYGNIYLNGTFSLTGAIDLSNSSGTATINTNGKSIYSLCRYTAGGTTYMLDAFTVSPTFKLTAGTFNVNGMTCTISSIALNSGTKVLTMGSCNMTIAGATGIDFATNATGFTFNCNTSIIHMTSLTQTFSGNGNTFYNVYFDGSTSSATISGSNTFNILKLAPTQAETFIFTTNTIQTVNSEFITTGSSGKAITIESSSTSAVANISSSSIIGCSNDYIINGVASSYYGVSYTGTSSGYLGKHSTSPGTSSGWNYCSACSCSTVAISKINRVAQSSISKINTITQSTGISKVDGVLDH